MQCPLAPRPAVLVAVGLIVGEAKQGKGGHGKYPAVADQPDRQGRASQAETGQDKGELSTEGVGQGRGDGPAAGEFLFHFLKVLTGAVTLAIHPLKEGCILTPPRPIVNKYHAGHLITS